VPVASVTEPSPPQAENAAAIITMTRRKEINDKNLFFI
jgi:hypothetical protein